jgi:lipopolysaccharide transport system ATP-binding protein
MSEAIITVSNLGKKYNISHQAPKQRYVALRDVLSSKVKGLFKNRRGPRGGKSTVEEFWALNDVSFEVKRGDVVGIIGRNGAGKSTLLKILSRITEPSRGEVHLYGRVSSLLEVGTGFHPELTGRENIFLNGAILGMARAEIRKKFDEIVAFAEVDQFLDTPVKRFSSGMYVRLAFAVAAHLEPEILIVDEVLAVGDAQFQRKCLGKMEDVSTKEGRTVLFVSHNMSAVQRLCKTGILLEGGRVKCVSNADEVLKVYSGSLGKNNTVAFSVDDSRPSISFITIEQSQLGEGNLVVDVGFKSPVPLNPPVVGLVVSSYLGTPVFGSNPRFHTNGYVQSKLSEGVLRLVANGLPIVGGSYRLSVWLGDWQTDYDAKTNALAFDFKHGHPVSNMPNPEFIGFADAVAKWSVLRERL